MARDYLALIPGENQDQPKFTATVELTTNPFSHNYDQLGQIPSLYDVDLAVGAQLDVVGQWVGQSRNIPNVLLIHFFGFDNNPAALNFGEENNPALGGRFLEEGESIAATTILADPEYRLVLKAKIVRNNAQGLTSDLISALTFLFGAPAFVYDPGIMAIGISIGRPLTLVEQAIVTSLDILPRPAGVRIYWLSYFAAEYFGFEGQVGALGFSEESEFLTFDGSWQLDGAYELSGFRPFASGGGVFAEEF